MMKKFYHEGEIILKWVMSNGPIVSQRFVDSNKGATEAAEIISERIGNHWKLEPFGPLGYRIVTEQDDAP